MRKIFLLFLVLSFAVSVTGLFAQSTLFFSEYIEGSSNNKALEIYNGTGAKVDLSTYQIAQAVNGGGWQYFHTFSAGDSLDNNDVWVIVTDEFTSTVYDTSNANEVMAYPSVVHHNGNDARALIKIVGTDTTWLDIIGDPDNNPGDGWDVAGVTEATKNHTLVRKTSVTSGNIDWTASAGTNADDSEWIVYEQDYFDQLGLWNAVDVTFNVNMRVKILEKKFDPIADNVKPVGSFSGWKTAYSPKMDDSDVDSIYSITKKLEANTEHQYKFVITDADWESVSNRVLNLAANDTILDVVYFDDDSVVTVTADGNILFTVKMDVMNEIGIYDPVKDSLQVRGGFNGWGDSQPLRSKMEQYFLDENEWFLDVSFEDEGVGNDQAYKFFVVIADTTTIWTDSWERPLSQGGGNRNINFEGSATQEAPIAYYDDVHPDWVVESGVNVQAIFSVDMSPAMDPNLQAVPFSPAADTVFWMSGQPSFAASQGWVDSTVNRVLMLTDDDSDSIYTGTMTVNTPAFNAFEYRYAFWHAGSEWVYEPSGFSDFAYRVRYVGQDAARSFPVIPWSMPLDTWTNDEVKTDQETDPFTSYVGVDDEIMPVPTIYTLNQNYPNPFNPVTTITYTLAKSGKINLAVYNLLGQKVRTLVNSNATAGLHINKWNGLDDHGKKVASGIYFYKLEAGNFTAVKKMIMLK